MNRESYNMVQYLIYSSKKETHSEILGRYRNKQISSKAMFN